VTKRELVVTADDKSKVYGDANPALTGSITGVQNGDPVTLGLSTAADKTSGVGTYQILAVANGTQTVLANYEVKPANGTLTVTRRELVVTADDKSKVYGDANPALTGKITGVQNGDVVTADYSTTATGSSGVGQYPIKGAAQGTAAVLANYDVRLVDGTLSVTKARLTLTADDQSKILGSANPALTFTVTGLVNGDTRSSALDSQPTVSTTATQGSGVGSYPITVSGGSASNYELVYVSGTLRVLFSWAGFLQPINDTAHQVGLYESKFKLGQTIPVKFVLSDASGNVVQQAGSPTFTRTDYLGGCDTGTDPEAVTTVTASSGATFSWTGSQYQYNWSTKGITKAGEYRIHANLADGTQRSVYICLTK
jgi:predicted secreted protein